MPIVYINFMTTCFLEDKVNLTIHYIMPMYIIILLYSPAGTAFCFPTELSGEVSK